MQLARIINGTVSAVGDYRSLFPQTSFSENGPSQSFLRENGCLQVSQWKAHDKATQKLVPVDAYVEGDQVFTVTVEALTTEDRQNKRKTMAAEARKQRDALMATTDWTQLEDYPKANKAAWKTYRQQLRDVPQQSGFPETITWPTSPDAPTTPNSNGAI
jgi:hypothetical protein